jgi:acyl-CoA synthetase (AMP-forming)/AMP-acid ligase II
MLDLFPEKIAVIDGERSFTYRQIGERVTGLALFLQNQGIQIQDRISILEVNSHAYLEAYYAAAGLGAILNPLNYRLAAKEVAFILKDAGSRWLIAAKQFAPVVKGVLKEDTSLEGILWIGEGPEESAAIASHNYDHRRAQAGGYRYLGSHCAHVSFSRCLGHFCHNLGGRASRHGRPI